MSNVIEDISCQIEFINHFHFLHTTSQVPRQLPIPLGWRGCIGELGTIRRPFGGSVHGSRDARRIRGGRTGGIALSRQL